MNLRTGVAVERHPTSAHYWAAPDFASEMNNLSITKESGALHSMYAKAWTYHAQAVHRRGSPSFPGEEDGPPSRRRVRRESVSGPVRRIVPRAAVPGTRSCGVIHWVGFGS
ncbi:hypothetical protein ACWGCW_04535 [Streptomyces sp. NPDC054933]